MKITDLCANLVPMLGVPASEFNELLRALREGSSHFREPGEPPPDILKAKPGPGGGLAATPFLVAFVIIALLTNGPRREAAQNTWRAWTRDYGDGPRTAQRTAYWGDETRLEEPACRLTGKSQFGDAIKAILADEDMASRVDEVRFGPDIAEIAYDNNAVSRFHAGAPKHPDFYRLAILNGIILQGLCQLLKRD